MTNRANITVNDRKHRSSAR